MSSGGFHGTFLDTFATELLESIGELSLTSESIDHEFMLASLDQFDGIRLRIDVYNEKKID